NIALSKQKLRGLLGLNSIELVFPLLDLVFRLGFCFGRAIAFEDGDFLARECGGQGCGHSSKVNNPGDMDQRSNTLIRELLFWAIYLAVACWLALDVRYYLGDALSRTQAAESILYSRNPNLSVMGFIFTPLTTLAQLPLAAVAPL